MSDRTKCIVIHLEKKSRLYYVGGHGRHNRKSPGRLRLDQWTSGSVLGRIMYNPPEAVSMTGGGARASLLPRNVRHQKINSWYLGS